MDKVWSRVRAGLMHRCSMIGVAVQLNSRPRRARLLLVAALITSMILTAAALMLLHLWGNSPPPAAVVPLTGYELSFSHSNQLDRPKTGGNVLRREDLHKYSFSALLERAKKYSRELSAKYCGGRDSIKKPYVDNFNGVKRQFSERFVNKVMDLMAVIHQQFTEHNIEYVIWYGTLLGSVFFHDMIPWDDDGDLCIKLSDVPRALLLINQIDGVVVEAKVRRDYRDVEYLKAYYDDRDPTKLRYNNYYWTLPFIDILIIDDLAQPDRMKQIDDYAVFPKDVLFPTHPRPMGEFWLSAPNLPYESLRLQYAYHLGHRMRFPCRLQPYDHVTEEHTSPVAVDCKALAKHYPVVTTVERDGGGDREKDSGIQYTEVLSIAGKTLYQCDSIGAQVFGGLQAGQAAHQPLQFPDKYSGGYLGLVYDHWVWLIVVPLVVLLLLLFVLWKLS